MERNPFIPSERVASREEAGRIEQTEDRERFAQEQAELERKAKEKKLKKLSEPDREEGGDGEGGSD